MAEHSVLAVGLPPTFRVQVARAMGSQPDKIEWVSAVAAARELVHDGQTPLQLIVLSPEVGDLEALDLAGLIRRKAPATAMVVVRDSAGNGFLPAAMRAGIRDVVDLSRGGNELPDALALAIQWSESLRAQQPGIPPGGADRRGRVVTVFSSKGGTGKTFLATNLAAAIAAKSGQDTALVDLDLDSGDVMSMFGKEATRSIRDLVALGDQVDRKSVLAHGLPVGEHLWAFAAPPSLAGEPIQGEAMARSVEALRSAFDAVVLDGTDDYTDHVLSAFEVSDVICLITGLDVIGVKHLSAALDTLLSLGLPRERFRIVLNRADSKVGLEVADVEQVLKLTVDAMIPSSRLVPTSINQGTPVFWSEPRSDVSKSVALLAEKLLTEPAARKRRLFTRA